MKQKTKESSNEGRSSSRSREGRSRSRVDRSRGDRSHEGAQQVDSSSSGPNSVVPGLALL